MRLTLFKKSFFRISAALIPVIDLALAISAFAQSQRPRFAEIDVQTGRPIHQHAGNCGRPLKGQGCGD